MLANTHTHTHDRRCPTAPGDEASAVLRSSNMSFGAAMLSRPTAAASAIAAAAGHSLQQLLASWLRLLLGCWIC